MYLGVGDFRNVALTCASLPDTYERVVTFALNDLESCILSRLVLIIYMFIKRKFGDHITIYQYYQIIYQFIENAYLHLVDKHSLYASVVLITKNLQYYFSAGSLGKHEMKAFKTTKAFSPDCEVIIRTFKLLINLGCSVISHMKISSI